MSLESEIREHLVRCLAGENSLQAFVEWFSARTWDVEASGEPAAEDLTADIELRLAEYTNGHWTEKELRSLLTQRIQTYEVV